MSYNPTRKKSMPFINEIHLRGDYFQCDKYIDLQLTKDEIDDYICDMKDKIVNAMNENIIEIELNKDISSLNTRLKSYIDQKLVEANEYREKLFDLDEKHNLKTVTLSEFKSNLDSFDLVKEKNLK